MRELLLHLPLRLAELRRIQIHLPLSLLIFLHQIVNDLSLRRTTLKWEAQSWMMIGDHDRDGRDRVM